MLAGCSLCTIPPRGQQHRMWVWQTMRTLHIRKVSGINDTVHCCRDVRFVSPKEQHAAYTMRKLQLSVGRRERCQIAKQVRNLRISASHAICNRRAHFNYFENRHASKSLARVYQQSELLLFKSSLLGFQSFSQHDQSTGNVGATLENNPIVQIQNRKAIVVDHWTNTQLDSTQK